MNHDHDPQLLFPKTVYAKKSNKKKMQRIALRHGIVNNTYFLHFFGYREVPISIHFFNQKNTMLKTIWNP